MYYHIKETGNLLIRELQKEWPDSGDFDPQWYEGIAIPNMHCKVPDEIFRERSVVVVRPVTCGQGFRFEPGPPA
jgi:hypothetical protein